jgi:hypothetical protein
MVEDEVVLGEPEGFVRWMVIGWGVLGAWYLYHDYQRMQFEQSL